VGPPPPRPPLLAHLSSHSFLLPFLIPSSPLPLTPDAMEAAARDCRSSAGLRPSSAGLPPPSSQIGPSAARPKLRRPRAAARPKLLSPAAAAPPELRRPPPELLSPAAAAPLASGSAGARRGPDCFFVFFIRTRWLFSFLFRDLIAFHISRAGLQSYDLPNKISAELSSADTSYQTRPKNRSCMRST
jgi:hypothetical protein